MKAPEDEDDPRLRSAWRTWLSALAVDAEAAVAASLAYESLAPEARDAWLEAIAADIDAIARTGVPAMALYAPLLAVEVDPERRLRIGAALAARSSLEGPSPHKSVRALCGRANTGEHVCLLLSPLYLDFVAVLVCRYRPERGFISARRDPVRNVLDVIGQKLGEPGQASSSALSCLVDGVAVTEAPLRDVVEELAHAIVADRHEGRAAPEALGAYVHLFVPDFGTSTRPSGAPSPLTGAA
jgi:hypothetical protein